MTNSKSSAPAALMLAIAMLAACTPASPQPERTPATPSSSSQSPPTAGTPSDPAPAASSDADLTLDKSSFASGAQVRMTIRSRTSDVLGFNPCNRTLERQDGSRWVKFEEPGRMCTMELWLLEPQATRSATTDLPASVPSGTYRVVLLLSRQKPGAVGNSGTVRAVSASFAVN